MLLELTNLDYCLHSPGGCGFDYCEQIRGDEPLVEAWDGVLRCEGLAYCTLFEVLNEAFNLQTNKCTKKSNKSRKVRHHDMNYIWVFPLGHSEVDQICYAGLDVVFPTLRVESGLE